MGACTTIFHLGLSLLLIQFIAAQSEFDVGVGQQQTSFGQKVDEESVKEEEAEAINTTEKRTFLYHSKDGKPMAIYDKLFKGGIILMLRSYLTTLGQDSWLFNNYDPDHINKQRASDNVPWVNYRDPAEFNKMMVSKTIAKAITDLTGVKEKWYPYKVTGKVIRRGDHTKVVADSKDPDEFSVLFYLNSKWRKNYYGELYFFDDDKEIMHGATPRPGRVVIWDSSILRLTRPPSVSFKQGQVLLHITYSKSQQKMIDEHEKWVAFWNEKIEVKKTWYLPEYKEQEGKPLVPNVADHVVANYSTLRGEKIFVFDDLFPKDLLDHMRAHVLKYGTYFYDDSIDSDSDNVQWIAGLDMQLYLESPYWKIIHAVATFASGSPEWFPYDVSTNLIRNADHTRIHLDTSGDDDKEWTFLVYLTTNWTQNFYGETAFFERNSDDTEIVAEVRPRYGRAVIFQGQIPHSARPPSLNFTGARLTFVTKLQQNEYWGRMKNLEEEARHFRSHAGAVEQLEALAQSGDSLTYIKKMKAIREQFKASKKQPATEEKAKPDVDGEDGEKPEDAEDTAEKPDAEEAPEEGAEDTAEKPDAEEGAEEGAEESEEKEPAAEGAEGEPEEPEEAEPEEGEEGAEDEDVSELVKQDMREQRPRQEEPEQEEEEDADPKVRYVFTQMADIKRKGDENAKRVAELYIEMKKRDAEIVSNMAEKFPSIL